MDATPAISSTSGEVQVEFLGDTMPASTPGSTLELTRITLPAGGEIESQDHPGAAVMFVESGVVEITLDAGEILLFKRVAGEMGPVTDPQPCGSPCRVEAESSAVQQGDTRHNLLDVSTNGSVVLISQFTATAVEAPASPAAGATPRAGRPLYPYGCDGGCR